MINYLINLRTYFVIFYHNFLESTRDARKLFRLAKSLNEL